jgi:hypothetical protein
MTKASKQFKRTYREEDLPGSHLDYERSRPVKWTQAHKDEETGEITVREITHGFVDPVLRVYQGGGTKTEIINWSLKTHPPLMSLMLSVWRDLLRAGDVDTWEMRDHYNRVCYSIPIERAKRVGVEYKTSMGKRWGVPVEYCDIVNQEGEFVQRGHEYEPPKLLFGSPAADPTLYIVKPKAKQPKKEAAF